MSEYWKSLPRKFCEICKCWFADNKASIEFHERGKRHQENVQKRIQDIQKRGIKEFKKQKELEDEMAKIEKAALAAYKKDVQNSALSPLEEESAPKLVDNLPEPPKCKEPAKKAVKTKKDSDSFEKKIVQPSPPLPTKIWYEAETDEGYKYYWNTETSESKWEPPEEGYVTLEEQNVNKDSTSENTDFGTDPKENDKDEDSDNATCAVGPQPKVDPYGQWVTVEQSTPEEIDLQLPKPSENIVEVVIPITKDEPKLKFKEKTIGQLADTDPLEEVTFKKRKFNGSVKRNTRQRTADDD